MTLPAAIARLQTKVESLEGSVITMREENGAAHASVRSCINEGLISVHKRIDRLQTTIVARWFALGAAIILILLGIVGWLITYLTKMQTGL